MKTRQYKGYEIRPTPLKLAEGKGWNHELYISKDRGSKVAERKFSTATTFATVGVAIKHGFLFGQQIIDGEIPDCSVEDL